MRVAAQAPLKCTARLRPWRPALTRLLSIASTTLGAPRADVLPATPPVLLPNVQPRKSRLERRFACYESRPPNPGELRLPTVSVRRVSQPLQAPRGVNAWHACAWWGGGGEGVGGRAPMLHHWGRLRASHLPRPFLLREKSACASPSCLLSPTSSECDLYVLSCVGPTFRACRSLFPLQFIKRELRSSVHECR